MSERNRTWKLRINKILMGDRWSYISPWFCSMSPPAVSDPTLLCLWVLPLQASPSGTFTISKQSPALTLGVMSYCSTTFFPKDMKCLSKTFPKCHLLSKVFCDYSIIHSDGNSVPRAHWASSLVQYFSVAFIAFWHKANCLCLLSVFLL